MGYTKIVTVKQRHISRMSPKLGSMSCRHCNRAFKTGDRSVRKFKGKSHKVTWYCLDCGKILNIV